MSETENDVYKLVAEYYHLVPDRSITVRAKIWETISGNSSGTFVGDFNHFCKQFDGAADVYNPSTISRNLDHTKYLVEKYLDMFTTEWEVRENRLFV